MDALEAMRSRRSYGRLSEPAPSDEQLRVMLEAGASAPDHGGLRPFRFTVLRGAAIPSFGSVLERAYLERCKASGVDPVPAKAEKERTKLGRAPLVVVVWAHRAEQTKIPWVDQRDAAVAAAQNVLVAAHALGFGGIWRTGEVCDDPIVKKALGCRQTDAIVGFLYVGTPADIKPPRDVDLSDLVSFYPGSGR